MRVLFDTSAVRTSNAGVSIYITELLAALRKVDLSICIDEFAYHPVFGRQTPLRVFDSLYRDALWPSVQFSARASKIMADLIHCPAFIFPVYAKQPVLTTIHDIYAFVKPQDFKFWHRNVSRYYIKKAVRINSHLIVQNEFTKKEILNYFDGANPDNIHVVYGGIAEKRQMTYDTYLNSEILQRHSVRGPYILSVSTIEPRKNFANLVKAFSILKDKIDHTLLLVGKSGWMNSAVYELVKKLNLDDRIRFTGFVDDTTLNSLYTHADCFVFPSFYEGFGFTPLEAMKGGSPVVSSNASCMPEILGDAAIYFDPREPEDMASAICRMLSDTELQRKHRQSGIRQSMKYTWLNTAVDTYKVYQKVIDSQLKTS